MKPRVSVILTSYNKPQTVGKAIQSVLRQTLKDWELFIMDDASNEETTLIIRKYLNDERIHYYNSQINNEDRYKTTRYATLINQAIPLTKGKYLSYLTDDTEYVTTRLKEMVTYLEKNVNVEVVYSGQIIQRVNNALKVISKNTRKTRGIIRKAANRVDHCSVLHSRKIAEKVFRKYQSYWDDDPKNWHNGDAAFWARLNEFVAFYPIKKELDISYKTPVSFQRLNAYLPSKIPDGILVKGLGSKVYLIDNQERREIMEGMFELLKYDRNKIVDIPDPVLYKFPRGVPIDEFVYKNLSLPNQRLIKAEGNNDTFYIQDNKKRKILDQKTLQRFHFKIKDVISIDNEVIVKIPDGPPIRSSLSPEYILPNGFIFKQGTDYYLSNRNKLHFIHKYVLNKLKFKEEESVLISKQELVLFEKGDCLIFELFTG
ncbi:glycosyltransferase family 2 protein [Halalkalibacter kiskunsagensis]|uniref:Glycosyltransferase family 2 protein n=1 Tax=Halalkalibacter kiskunsagensis TaxID=1548599 RepID=A0ABV6K9W2_9BACI